jgi:hypothetical protein
MQKRPPPCLLLHQMYSCCSSSFRALHFGSNNVESSIFDCSTALNCLVITHSETSPKIAHFNPITLLHQSHHHTRPHLYPRLPQIRHHRRLQALHLPRHQLIPPPPNSTTINTTYIGGDTNATKSLSNALSVPLPPQFTLTTWATLSSDLKAGKFDIAMSGISITTKRALKAFFSSLV